MISRFRITQNGTAFRIEEYRRCGFLWLRKDWRQVHFGYHDGEFWMEQRSEFSTIEEARGKLASLVENCSKIEDPWTVVTS